MILDSPKKPSESRHLARHLWRRGFRRGSYWALCAISEKLGIRRWLHLAIADVFSAVVTDLLHLERIPRAFKVRAAEQDDLAPLQAFFGDSKQVLRRFSQGHCCLLLHSDHTVNAAEWVAAGPNHYEEDWDELHCVFRVSAGAGWLFDGLGSVSGGWGMLMRVLPRELEKRHIERVYLQTDYANILSWESHRSLGFVPVGKICHLRIAGLGFTAVKVNGSGGWRSLPVKIAELEITAK